MPRLPFYKPDPAPPGVFEGVPFPQSSANPLSRLFFHWITPLMKVGYSRPLQEDDLWTIPDDMACRGMADRLEREWMKRIPPSLRPEHFRHEALGKEDPPDALALLLSKTPKLPKQGTQEANTKKFGKRKASNIAAGKVAEENGTLYDMSLPWAIYSTDVRSLVISSLLEIAAGALTVTSPLVTKILIQQIVLSHDYHEAMEADLQPTGQNPAKPAGYGIGVAIGLAVMLFSSAVFDAQAIQRAQMLGALMRAATIDVISRKSMRLSGKARLTMTNGRINNMVTADASYIEWTFYHSVKFPSFTLEIIIGIALLIWLLGYSALVGLALLIGSAPLQGWMFKRLLDLRTEQSALVDDRVRLLTEVVGNMRAVKQYAYEDVFSARVMALRELELASIRRYTLMRASVNGTFFFIPVGASILTFITYSLSRHHLDAATIFSALQLFNIVRDPIQSLPISLSNWMNGLAAMNRIGDMLKSEELRERINIDETAEMAVRITGDFQFDSEAPPDQAKGRDYNAKKSSVNPSTPDEEKQGQSGKPFALRDLNLSIPRGSLVCVVGRVGTGKTTLLLAMINELRQVHGQVLFGGPVSYVPQHAWVQSGTVRDNITFSKPEKPDLTRVDHVIDACALRPDVEMWHDGDQTKIGERGITLSGGQRQRICIARAAYEDTAVVLLDDPLSAVDAHVGHHLVEHCLLTGPFAHRTRFLVTHQLDVLPHANLILVMDRNEENEGRIVQQGTYQELLDQEGIFHTLIADFGSSSAENSENTSGDGEDEAGKDTATEAKDQQLAKGRTTTAAGGGGGHIVIDEERFTGSVSGKVYKRYILSVQSWGHVLMAGSFLLATEACNVGTSLFLGYWSEDKWSNLSQGQYMAIYGAFGVAYAIAVWGSIYTMMVAGMRAGFGMFNGAFYKVMRSPTGWHDRTPTGRIISRLSKDVQMLDDKLPQYWQQFLANILAIFGTMALLIYAYPWLGLAFIPLFIYFFISASYYRATSREVKRVDSNLRSHVYSSFSEQLAGLAVIRAFNQQLNFQKRIQDSVDSQNRAYILTITTQRWLALRLEFCADMLVMLIAIFGTVFRDSVNAARFGVVMTYTLAATYTITGLVPIFAMCEQEMNNVERIQYYMDLETEADAKKPTDPTEDEWPKKGEVKFDNVQLKYREDLSLVLKGLSFTINPGEKVGIIGRTGAGKSSIAQALLRTVEISGGKMTIDDLNLSGLGLDTLRTGIAIIPQDAFLFAGTVRDNMDPKGVRTDAELNDALSLIQNSAGASHSLRDKFKLDAPVLAEGHNFSAGEKQLLALMRALARGCKVLLLDEATSSVDPETDALIQKIIQNEFSHVTLISIAHRLQTVAFYDRILVMDAGEIAEFDTPLALFDDSGSIFRAMCEKKSITRRELLKIQADAAAAVAAHNSFQDHYPETAAAKVE